MLHSKASGAQDSNQLFAIGAEGSSNVDDLQPPEFFGGLFPLIEQI
jgi:hypothetical protein